MSAALISINEAAAQGIERLRKPAWANKFDHLKIDIVNGEPGPWTHLYAPFNKECNGRDPVDIICTMMDYKASEYVPYDGPLSTDREYIQAVQQYDGCLTGDQP